MIQGSMNPNNKYALSQSIKMKNLSNQKYNNNNNDDNDNNTTILKYVPQI